MSERLDGMVIPKHVALILDGNGRWAKKRGLPRSMGHKEGCVTVEKTVEIAARMGIEYLTVYGFSTENWKRSAEEVGALMQLFRFYMVRLLKVASANNVRVKMIGDRTRFDRNWFYLHQFRNVIMTQHMAFYTEQAVDSMVQCGIEGIVKMAEEGTYSTML